MRHATFLLPAVLGLALLASPPPARAGGAVGEPAPNFTLENVLDFAPDTFTLSQYRGSVVVLVFFAYW